MSQKTKLITITVLLIGSVGIILLTFTQLNALTANFGSNVPVSYIGNKVADAAGIPQNANDLPGIEKPSTNENSSGFNNLGNNQPANTLFSSPVSECNNYIVARGFATYHRGIDITKAGGCTIVAAAEGTVVSAGFNEITGFAVRLKHANNMYTNYFHFKADSIKVKEGDYIKVGQVLGEMGSTGRTTGLNLHFEIMKGEETVDPDHYIKF